MKRLLALGAAFYLGMWVMNYRWMTALEEDTGIGDEAEMWLAHVSGECGCGEE